jgi:hypothetical protein
MIPCSLLEAPGAHFPRRARQAIQLGLPGFIALTVTGVCASSHAPFNAALPFSVGEKLTYEVRVAKGGKVGTAILSIDSQNSHCKE